MYKISLHRRGTRRVTYRIDPFGPRVGTAISIVSRSAGWSNARARSSERAALTAQTEPRRLRNRFRNAAKTIAAHDCRGTYLVIQPLRVGTLTSIVQFRFTNVGKPGERFTFCGSVLVLAKNRDQMARAKKAVTTVTGHPYRHVRNKLIVEQQVTNQVVDMGLLAETAEPAKEVLGVERIAVVADRGYFKIEDIEACEEAGIDPYVPRP
jgi:hypothetical protein